MGNKAKEYTEKQYYKVDDVDEFNGEPLAVYRAYTQCQEYMTKEILFLIDTYKSDILKLEKELQDKELPIGLSARDKDDFSLITLTQIQTLQFVISNLEIGIIRDEINYKASGPFAVQKHLKQD